MGLLGAMKGLGDGVSDVAKRYIDADIQKEKDAALEAKETRLMALRAATEDQYAQEREKRVESAKGREFDPDIRIDGEISTREDIRKQNETNKVAKQTEAAVGDRQKAFNKASDANIADVAKANDASLANGKFDDKWDDNAYALQTQGAKTGAGPDEKEAGLIGQARSITSSKESLADARIAAAEEKMKTGIALAEMKGASVEKIAEMRMDMAYKLKQLQVDSKRGGAMTEYQQRMVDIAERKLEEKPVTAAQIAADKLKTQKEEAATAKLQEEAKKEADTLFHIFKPNDPSVKGTTKQEWIDNYVADKLPSALDAVSASTLGYKASEAPRKSGKPVSAPKTIRYDSKGNKI